MSGIFGLQKSGHGTLQALNENQINLVNQLQAVLSVWQVEYVDSNFDPIDTLNGLAELVEKSREEYLRQDPDPLDHRHPIKTSPSCTYGHMLKILARNTEFINKLCLSYLLARDNTSLNISAARLLLSCMKGVDATSIFTEAVMPQLYRWAERSDTDSILRSMSYALLAYALESTDIASKYKAENAVLIPVALRLLKEYFEKMKIESQQAETFSENNIGITSNVYSNEGPLSQMQNESSHKRKRPVLAEFLETSAKHPCLVDSAKRVVEHNSENNDKYSVPLRMPQISGTNPFDNDLSNGVEKLESPPRKKARLSSHARPKNSSTASLVSLADDLSNSQWTELQKRKVGNCQIYPITTLMHQKLILKYLISLGEYQDLLKEAYENRSLEIICTYLEDANKEDVRLTFFVLRYLASLLVHRKFAMDFVAAHGVEKLIRVDQQSFACVAVGTCLYYLAYNYDVLEQMNLLSESVLDKIVKFQLWMLEHSHESGRGAATMFFAYSFQLRAILERFDNNDGSRRLLNYISTLTLLQAEERSSLPEELLFTSFQAVRNTCAAFRSYVASHVCLKVEHFKRTYLPRIQSTSGLKVPTHLHGSSNKSLRLDDEALKDCVWLLVHIFASHNLWKPVEALRELGVIKMMFDLIGIVLSVNNFVKNETIKNSLEVIWMCSILPRVQLDICEIIVSVEGVGEPAIGILLDLCDGERISEPEIQKIALNILINCVCSPVEKLGSGRLLISNGSPSSVGNKIKPENDKSFSGSKSNFSLNKTKKNRKNYTEYGEVLEKMWDAVRKNDGIMVLKSLLLKTSPITEADAIRTLVCQILNGLARCEEVRQILSEMPLIADNVLLGLMREPVLPDKRAEHLRFCEQARLLIERVTQKNIDGSLTNDFTQEKIWKSAIISRTKINFNEKELLQLIHQHLCKKGLKKTAEQLQIEAELPDVPASLFTEAPVNLQPFPSSNSSFSRMKAKSPLQEAITPCYSASNYREEFIQCRRYQAKSFSTHHENKYRTSASFRDIPRNKRSLTTPSAKQSKTPIFDRTNISEKNARLNQSLHISVNRSTPNGSDINSFNKNVKTVMKPYKDLEGILMEYFRKQHAMCNNPISNCPPFSVFFPHKCPHQRRHYFTQNNIAARFFNKPIDSLMNSYESRKADERFVFSRLRPIKTFSETDETFTCCSFSIDDEHVVLGTYAGSLHWYNVNTGVEESLTECHHSAITVIEQSRDGSLLLTSSSFVKPLSSLWKIGETQDHKFNFVDDYYVEFSKAYQNRIIGTRESTATIYDVETSQSVVVLHDEALSSHYTRNRATFHPLDNLVLNDGVLWDIRCASQALHKFDKLNMVISGVFHPHGNEVIINTEVWDVRMYHLLHSVPTLDRCKIVFNRTGNILCAAIQMNPDDEEFQPRNALSSSFRTFDAINYQVISTIDTKKGLFDLCFDHKDEYMAVIEAHTISEDVVDLRADLCRLFEIGKHRDIEDLDEQEEANENDDNDDDDSSSNSSDDADGVDDDDIDEDGNDEDESGASTSSDDNDYSDSSDSGSSHNEYALGHDVQNGDASFSEDGDPEFDPRHAEVLGAVIAAVVDNGDRRNSHEVEIDLGDEEVDDLDSTFNPDDETAESRHGTSSIVLNPILRRQRKREQDRSEQR